jgi:plasmid stability protein
MATLTIKNIPDPLYRRLKQKAGRHRRSLNGEVIASLEQAVQSAPFDPATFLARARKLREATSSYWLKDKTLNKLKRAGRL